MDESWNDPSNPTGDNKLLVRFLLHAQKDEGKTAEEGRPVFRDAEYVEIIVPGDKNNIVCRPVRPQDRQRFPRQYHAFKNGLEQESVGTPLKEWPAVSRSQVEELAYFKVKTVEQLAELSDANAKNIGPILALRQKAKDWLEKAKGGAVESRLRATVEEQNSQIEMLRRQVEELAARSDKKGKEKN